MLAWMNREALNLSIATGETHFYSRSRQSLWHKGGTSGHVQAIEEIRVDCDADVLLIRVRQTGGACHEGYVSCFFRKRDGEVLQIDAERQFDPARIYPGGS